MPSWLIPGTRNRQSSVWAQELIREVWGTWGAQVRLQTHCGGGRAFMLILAAEPKALTHLIRLVHYRLAVIQPGASSPARKYHVHNTFWESRAPNKSSHSQWPWGKAFPRISVRKKTSVALLGLPGALREKASCGTSVLSVACRPHQTLTETSQ